MFVSRGNTMLGSAIGDDNVEKYYLKKVSPAEKMKIEFEDQIEKLGYTFEIRNISNLYEAYEVNN
jgi:hypothetical protein